MILTCLSAPDSGLGLGSERSWHGQECGGRDPEGYPEEIQG